MNTPYRLSTLGAALMLAATAAQAQNTPRYAMTVLTIPAGATHSSAFVLDAAGNARGSINTETSTTTICGGSSGIDLFDLFPRLCKGTRYSANEATWPASSRATQSPTLGTTNFVTLGAASNGTLIGVRSKFIADEAVYWDPVQPPATGNYVYRSYHSSTPRRIAEVSNYKSALIGTNWKSLAVKKGNTVTALPFAPSTGLSLDSLGTRYMQAHGLSGAGVALINAQTYEAGTSAAYLFSAGKYTRLNDSLAPGRLMGTAISEQGTVAGVRLVTPMANDAADSYMPIRWQGSAAAELGGNELRGFYPEAINNSGQVLLHRYNRGADQPRHDAAVWLNGALTPITPPADDGTQGKDPNGTPLGVIPVAMNNRGDVVGCGLFPFVWRDGVMVNLNQVLAASGVKTPNGNPLSCVSAINDQGVILANYVLSTPSKRVSGYGWLRLSPLP
jgi:hypothetical protein